MGSSMRGFSTTSLSTKIRAKNDLTKEVLENLAIVEEQAIRLVRILKEDHFLTVEDLHQRLTEQPLPAVDLQLVAAFLAGYLAGEAFDSRFDVALFGSMSVLEAKTAVVAPALHAILTMINEKNVGELPNRLPGGGPVSRSSERDQPGHRQGNRAGGRSGSRRRDVELTCHRRH